MAFCQNCGASVEGKFCARCGTSVGQPAPAGATGVPPPPNYGTTQAPYVPPPTDAAGMSDNLVGTLCYSLGLVTGVVFLVLAPYNQNRNIRFHAFQSIFFHVAVIAMWIVVTILYAILFTVLPIGLYGVISLLGGVVWLGSFVLWILLMVKAYQGEHFKLPVIGDLAEKQA